MILTITRVGIGGVAYQSDDGKAVPRFGECLSSACDQC